MRARYTQEIKEFIHEHYEGVPYQALADQINETFGTAYTGKQIRSYCNKRGMSNGRDGRYRAYLYPREVKAYIREHH